MKLLVIAVVLIVVAGLTIAFRRRRSNSQRPLSPDLARIRTPYLSPGEELPPEAPRSSRTSVDDFEDPGSGSRRHSLAAPDDDDDDKYWRRYYR